MGGIVSVRVTEDTPQHMNAHTVVFLFVLRFFNGTVRQQHTLSPCGPLISVSVFIHHHHNPVITHAVNVGCALPLF